MSGVSPIKHSTLISPPSSPKSRHFTKSIKVESPQSLSPPKKVNLYLGPRSLTDPNSASIAINITRNFRQPNYVDPILYKATSTANFIHFCHTLEKMKRNEVSNIISIDLSYFNDFKPAGFETYLSLLISKCPFLEEIIWGFALPINEILTSFIGKFKNLKKLNLSKCGEKIKDQDLRMISLYMPNLTHLNLETCCNITDQGIEKLKTLSKLTDLRLGFLDKVTDSSLQSLKTLYSLTYLDLFDTEITDIMPLRRHGLKIVYETETVILDYWPG